MPLHLITADLDAYEAEQAARRDLRARYAYAVYHWDALEIARVEALAADYDARHPGEQPVLAGIEPVYYPAAA